MNKNQQPKQHLQKEILPVVLTKIPQQKQLD